MVGKHCLVITDSQGESDNIRVIYELLNVVYVKVSIFDWLEELCTLWISFCWFPPPREVM